MDSQHITVVYKWNAHEGNLDQLTSIYQQVTNAMQEQEPGALAVFCYKSEEENALYVRDEFRDAAALAYHLQHTAAAHFGSLLEIATPGPFYFFGDVPAELQQAARQMGLAAEFAQRVSGFER